jgi:AcrR family transcriptional regulator
MTARAPGTPSAEAAPARRRGRRPAGEDTRGVILAAALAEFARDGYERTTLRGIARAAGVDARLVHHYFAGKEEVFVAALDFPASPQEIVARVLADGPQGVGERLARTFIGVWDAPGAGDRMRALISGALGSEAGARMLREFVTREILGRIAVGLDVPDPHLRAALAASQVLGLGMARWVVGIEPLVEADTETLVRLVGPTLERYLTEP